MRGRAKVDSNRYAGGVTKGRMRDVDGGLHAGCAGSCRICGAQSMTLSDVLSKMSLPSVLRIRPTLVTSRDDRRSVLIWDSQPISTPGLVIRDPPDAEPPITPKS